MPGPNREYDIVIAGGGVNGITVGCYLAKAGFKVAIFERKLEAGSGACTEEVMHPGVKVNLCACNMVTMWSPAYDDLELEKFGLEMLTSGEWSMFHPFRDRSTVMFHTYDAQKQYEHWKTINAHDAEVFKKAFNFMGPNLANFLGPMMFSQTVLTPDQIVKNDMMGKMMRTLIPEIPENLMECTGAQVIEAVYQDERIRTAIAANCIMAGFHPWEKGFHALMALVYPVLACTHSSTWTCRGGSHALTHALCSCFAYHGGRLFTGCPVDKIIMENGEAKGIVTSKHAVFPDCEVRATKAVVSNLSCHPTFLGLIGEDKLPSKVLEGVKAYENEDVVLFTNYWVLNKPPKWEGYPEAVNTAYGFTYGLESMKDVYRLQHCLENHELPDPPIVAGLSVQGFCLADPTQAPSGEYTMMSWSNVPYRLGKLGGPEKWDEIRESYGDKVDDLLAQYNPEFRKNTIARYCNSPLDYYRKNPSQVDGSTVSGSVSFRYYGANRPFPGCGAPRTPFQKLYISNSMWPPGYSNLSAGYICATILADDLKARKGTEDWWKHKPLQPGIRVLKNRGIDIRWMIR